jgi:hypothetical protein
MGKVWLPVFLSALWNLSVHSQDAAKSQIYSAPLKGWGSAYCWFVSKDGKGNSGYAFSSQRGYIPPDGVGLAKSIFDVRRWLLEKRISTVTPGFPGSLPSGWETRDLSTNEFRQLIRGNPPYPGETDPPLRSAF